MKGKARIMKIFVVSEMRAYMEEGRIYLASQHFYILKRYYESFGKLMLCARKAPYTDVSGTLLDATEFIDEFVGLTNISNVFVSKTKKRIITLMEKSDLVVCRLGSIMAATVAGWAQNRHIPYMVEVMSDTWDAFWNHSIKGKLIAPIAFLQAKKAIWNASYASYVTSSFLQKRYPCQCKSVAASNVMLEVVDEQALCKRIERITSNHFLREITIMTTAAVDVKYKGQEYVIKAIPLINQMGIKVKYKLVGDGDTTYLRDIAKQENVEDQVCFLGRLSLENVYQELDACDIYLQPSLQEGLPRSVIEAMSRACCCIGARTAGIPELLDRQFIVSRKNYQEIAELIIWYVHLQENEKISISKRNFDESKKYETKELDKRRKAYYDYIKLSKNIGVRKEK